MYFVLWGHCPASSILTIFTDNLQQLQPGEQHIVDNGHLVAWSCDYSIEKAGGGSMTSLKTGEGLVCRFTGPGSIYIQTRNMDEFATFIRAVAGPQ
jgi:uncharacterized protein (AIM24 family)